MASDKAASWYFASRSVVYSSIIARGSVGWILCLCVFPPAMNLSKSGILSYFCLLVLSWMCSIHIYIMDESVHGVHSPDAAASGWRNTIIAPMDNRKRPPLKVFLNHYLCQRKHWGFPFRNSSQSHWASVVVQLVKNLPANAGDTRDVGSLPGGGNGNPLQYSCLKNSHGQRSPAVHRVPKRRTWLKRLSTAHQQTSEWVCPYRNQTFKISPLLLKRTILSPNLRNSSRGQKSTIKVKADVCQEVEWEVKSVRPIVTHLLKDFLAQNSNKATTVCALVTLEST